MFSMANSKPHSTRKRIISNVYSKSYLQNSPEVHQISKVMIFERLLPLLDEVASNKQSLDVLELNFSSTMDFIIAFIFGVQNGTNFIQNLSERQHWLSVYQSRRPFRFWAGELPDVQSFFKRIGINIVPKLVNAASKELENWTLAKCEAASLSTKSSRAESSNHQAWTDPIVYNQLSTSLQTPSTKETWPHPLSLSIATELHDHLAAGHETSGITLTYLFHELSLRPNLQKQLRSELLTLSPSLLYKDPSADIPAPRTIDALPLLHACLMETLRIHAAIPGPQPRITPPTPTSLAGSPPLPPGIRVSAQAYTLHRNANIFPNPEAWKPERWLEASEEKKAEMGRWFWAFGSGGRMCVGSNFAMQGIHPFPKL